MENRIDDDKLKHIRAVAEVMYDNAEALKDFNIDKEVAFTVGMLHDIGYIRGKDNHSRNGADIVNRVGFDNRFSEDNVNAIKFHGTDGYRMIQEGNIKHISPMLILLQYADMTVDKYGNKVGFDKRLEDIKDRYGENSATYNNCCKEVNFLKEVCFFEMDTDRADYPLLCPLKEREFYDRIGDVFNRLTLRPEIPSEKETEYDRE